jgi:hypothetical protein
LEDLTWRVLPAKSRKPFETPQVQILDYGYQRPCEISTHL